MVARWSVTHGVNLVLIIVGAFVVIRAANLAIDHLQFKLARRHTTTDLEWQRRAATLGGILARLVTTVVGFTAILMVLRELSVDVIPILTGAGIAGLAIGFGAQNLVRDVISGFFLILEDQVRVGDLARINGVTGTVEHINLRTIILRDGEGAVQVFPNGTITALANLSKQYAYAVVDIRVAYNENINRVMGTIQEVGSLMERDATFGAARPRSSRDTGRRVARWRSRHDPRQVQNPAVDPGQSGQRAAAPPDGHICRPRHSSICVEHFKNDVERRECRAC